MSPRWGYPVLIVLPLVGFALMAYSALAHRHPERGSCWVWVRSPVTVSCTDGHSYVRQGRAWVDLGTRSPGGRMPRR